MSCVVKVGVHETISVPKGLRLMLRDKYEIDKFFIEIRGLRSEMDIGIADIDKILDDGAIY